MLIGAVSVGLLASVATKATIWEADLTVQELADRLTSTGLHVNASADVRDRRVTIFCRDRPCEEVGEKVAEALDLRWKKRAFGWAFEADHEADKLKSGHVADVKRQTNQVLDDLYLRMRQIPPAYPDNRESARFDFSNPESNRRPRPLGQRQEEWRRYSVAKAAIYGELSVRWMLAHATDEQYADFRRGGTLLGACPSILGLIQLPGQPFEYTRGGPRPNWVIVYARWDAMNGVVRTVAFESGGWSTGETSVFSAGLGGELGWGWSRLSDRYPTWQLGRTSNYRFEDRVGKKRTYSSILEAIARAKEWSVVSEASPYYGQSSAMRFCSLTKPSGTWRLFKPNQFWDLKGQWERYRLLQEPGNPNVADLIESMDWAANLRHRVVAWGSFSSDEPAIERSRYQMADRLRFAEFWLALSKVQKKRAIGSGLTRKDLNATLGALFDEALFEAMRNERAREGFRDFFDPQKAPLAVLRVTSRPGWGHESDAGMGISSRPNPDPGRSIPPPTIMWPIEGHVVTTVFSLPTGAIVAPEFYVTKRGAPMNPPR